MVLTACALQVFPRKGDVRKKPCVDARGLVLSSVGASIHKTIVYVNQDSMQLMTMLRMSQGLPSCSLIQPTL